MTTISSARLDAALILDAANPDSGAQFLRNQQNQVVETLQDSSSNFLFDRVFFDENASLLDTTSINFDMYDLGTYNVGNGAGRDNVGLTHANAKIIYLFIRNRSTSTGNLEVNTSQTNGWTNLFGGSSTKTLAPGASMREVHPAGIAVTDAANHILQLAAASGDLSFDFEFLSNQT